MYRTAPQQRTKKSKMSTVPLLRNPTINTDVYLNAMDIGLPWFIKSQGLVPIIDRKLNSRDETD